MMLVLDDKNGPEFAPKRASVQQVYAQILNDLETAAPLFVQKNQTAMAVNTPPMHYCPECICTWVELSIIR
ncbi:hypothetical protein KUH03_31625 [Sphingobacterium sp. E70]|uniref:hypothetical protein n=1 Tax=Sphingobacterium sp. E70 TaxID=2853439 RepID=UPI00211CED68|nr:hypothetical protein [Sphingobacterium sp. E70]ULT23672.1 hypothetical protein KUH03_31625 [Sphingobacterium sp. E70]